MLRDLQTLNMPVEKLNEVVHVVGRGFGLEINDNVSMHTIGHVMQEGGIASEMQLVHKIDVAKVVLNNCPFENRFSNLYLGFTVSGDGTTIKHLNYEATSLYLSHPILQVHHSTHHQK